MWPFSRKTIPVPYQPIDAQLKSLTLPQAQPHWKLFAAKQRDWNINAAIHEGYNASAIVYACTERRAKLLASVPWRAQIIRGGEWQDAPDTHPLNALITSPNPDQSWYELMYNAEQSLCIAGNAFISEIKAGTRGYPVQLWYLPAEYMRISPGREKLVDYFEYTNGAVRRRIESDDMIQLKLPNPADPIFGQPVLKAAGRATDIDRESGIWQKVSLQNTSGADVHIHLPEEATQEQADAVRQRWKERQAGPINAREPIITQADVKSIAQSAKEMDFVLSRRQVWVEIAAAFGMSLSNLGMTESVNLANAEAMEKTLWKDTIIPELELIQRQLNHQLAIEFGTDVRLAYDLSNVTALQENLDSKLTNAQKLFALGVPLNVINQHLEIGLDEIDGGDVSYLPAGLMPAGWEASLGGEASEQPVIADASETLQVTEDVQATAFNGSQISSMQAIVQPVADGLLPAETAIQLIVVSFPSISEEQARRIIDPADGFNPQSINDQEKQILKKLGYGD